MKSFINYVSTALATGMLLFIIGLSIYAYTYTVEAEIVPVVVEIPQVEFVQIIREDPKTVKETVEEFFAQYPIMIEVARCESTFRQFKDGSVLRGQVNPKDVGVMQINEYWHLETSRKLGFDIYTLEGNLAYGKYLYEKEGTKPWNASRTNWNTSDISSL